MIQSPDLFSMTGFARSEGGDARLIWTWEVKSVNGRALDVRCRVPQGYETLEAAARELAPRYCRRGTVQIGLTLDRSESAPRLRVNQDLLDEIVTLADELRERTGAAPARVDGLLSIRGVLETVEDEESPEARKAGFAALRADLETLLDRLVQTRRAEGCRLGALLLDHLTSIEGLVEQAGAVAALQPDALRARLTEQIAALVDPLSGLSEDRLNQEVAILVGKADVREELDRLRSHIAAARDLLAEGGAVGRKFDFLCQEFNREANTLCSKSSDVDLTRLGLDLKNAIEQMREQVQNLE